MDSYRDALSKIENTLSSSTGPHPAGLLTLVTESTLSAPLGGIKFPPTPCYLLLYMVAGSGRLTANATQISLSRQSLLFLNCKEGFQLAGLSGDWCCRLICPSGDALFSYETLLQGHAPALSVVLPGSAAALALTQLTESANASVAESAAAFHAADSSVSGSIGTSSADFADTITVLQQHTLLTTILTEHISAVLSKDQERALPSYLLEMKALFNAHYDEEYSLDDLAGRFQISKYRLCREFHGAFGRSPLQYLNGKRIEAAKQLLLTTSSKVHEIGSLVGIDNTTHFIALFKKQTGVTPLVYRERNTTAFSQHSPSSPSGHLQP